MNPNGINKDKWKVKIKVIKNLINSPIIFNENNKAELNEDRYLVNGFQSATMPLVESVFYKIIDLAYDDKNLIHDKDIDLIDFDKLANDNNGIRILNKIYQNADIKKKEKFVKVIERGKIASEIKKYVGYKCQVCEALGKNPYGFKKKNGDYYVETHHIIPVTDTEKSKLSVENLICVCPNHHRQIHYGNVGIISDNNKYIEYKIDDNIIKINKIDLDNI
ncbi:putative restriction endonuclease [[Clostridium] sordellii]|nr:putative restriction endonuclease [[Clostridium] sordellii] [Paeniclostridium sordellii]